MCPFTDMTVKLHMYVPLHYYCNLHIDLTLMHIQVQNIYCKVTLHIFAKYVLETTMLLKCHIYTTYANYFLCTYEIVYIAHMNSLHQK